MIPYREFAQQYASLSEEEFLRQIKEPHVLMVERRNLRESESGFMTVKFTKEALAESSETRTFVLPIKKRAGSNAFGMMITLGRAPNNDLVVDHQKISKFHAYFRDAGSSWLICDADSRNGTVVDGVPLEPGQQGRPVHSGTRVKLGQVVELVFYLPKELYKKLKEG
ncbi:MAG: FHA domain-containing protein [Planctomycetota bacterium]